MKKWHKKPAGLSKKKNLIGMNPLPLQLGCVTLLRYFGKIVRYWHVMRADGEKSECVIGKTTLIRTLTDQTTTAREVTLIDNLDRGPFL